MDMTDYLVPLAAFGGVAAAQLSADVGVRSVLATRAKVASTQSPIRLNWRSAWMAPTPAASDRRRGSSRPLAKIVPWQTDGRADYRPRFVRAGIYSSAAVVWFVAARTLLAAIGIAFAFGLSFAGAILHQLGVFLSDSARRRRRDGAGGLA